MKAKVTMQAEKTKREVELEKKRSAEKLRRCGVAAVPLVIRHSERDVEFALEHRLKVVGGVTVHRCL